MKNCFLTILLFISLGCIFGQQEKRIEFDLKGEYIDEEIATMGEKGILVQSFGTEINKGTIKFSNEFFSTDLDRMDTKYIDIPARTKFGLVYYDPSQFVNYSLLFGQRNYFAIIKADANQKSVEKFEFEYDQKVILSQMIVKNDIAYFKGIINKTNKLLIVDMKTGKVKDVDFEFDKYRRTDITLEDYQVLDDGIVVYVNVSDSKRVENLYLFELNLAGERTMHYPLTLDFEKKLISISTNKFGDKYILSGTYGEGRKKMSQGLFFGEVKDKKLVFIEFYNFLDLNNFLDYLPEKKQEKIERRKKRATEQGRELILDYNIALHPIKEVDDGYELLGEFFFPVYIYMQCGNSTCTFFDGFQYTHAVMAKFDKQGKLIWDASFEMWVDSRPFYVKRFITKNSNPLGIEMAFGNGKELVYKVVSPDNGKVIKEESQKIIDTQKEDDNVKRSYSDVEHWYDDYFVAYGIQKITNKKEKNKRKVFFINKVKVKS